MLDAGVLTNRARNNKFAMHNVRATAGFKTLSHTQPTVFYWLDQVNASVRFWPKIMLQEQLIQEQLPQKQLLPEHG